MAPTGSFFCTRRQAFGIMDSVGDSKRKVAIVWRAEPVLKRFLTAVCGSVLSLNVGLCAARTQQCRQDDGIRLSSGLKIISVSPRTKRVSGDAGTIGIASEMVLHPQPPLAGFSPLVAITTSDQKSADDFDWEHRMENSYVGRPLNAPAEENYVIGILDTGSAVDLVAGANAEILGLVGQYVTDNEAPIGGIGGEITALVTQPIGLFSAGLGAIQPDGRLDLSKVTGHSNVCAVVTPPIVCGDIEVTAALGNPLLAFKSTEIRVDRPRKAIVADRVYIGPDIVIRSSYTPSTKDYPRRIPIELGGLSPVTTASYYAMFDPFDPWLETVPTAPTALSMFALGIPTGGAFFAEIGLLQGEPGPLNPIQTLRVMVDTGAQSSIISPNVAAKLNLPIEPDFVAPACGIAGSVEIPGYYIDYVRINALGGALEYSRVPFVMIDIQSPEGGPLDGVLGMNFFWNRNIVLEPSTSGGGSLHVSNPVPYAYIDLNLDNLVNMQDFAIFAAAWHTTPADPAWDSQCDFYLDEVIDSRDLAAFAEAWVSMFEQ